MKLLKKLDAHLEEFICVLALAFMTAVIFIQIVLRLTSKWITVPMAWTEEIGRYLFIYAVYVGAAYATKERKHQRVDLLPIMCGPKGKLIFELIADIGLLVFAGVMTYYTWEAMYTVGVVFVQKAPATKLNMGLAYFGPMLGMLLCTYRSIQNIVFHIKQFAELGKGGDK